MPNQSPIRAVIDTNVVFEGLTKKGCASGLIVDAWLADVFNPFASNALVYEYLDVLSNKLTKVRWQKIKPVLGKLLNQVEYVTIYFTWRPSSPDPGDELVIDCAMNAGAIIVTHNKRDFTMAEQALGVQVITPAEFVKQLAS